MAKRIRDKKVEESLTETTKLLQYKYINGQNRLFGGQLMAWIDKVAARYDLRSRYAAFQVRRVPE